MPRKEGVEDFERGRGGKLEDGLGRTLHVSLILWMGETAQVYPRRCMVRFKVRKDGSVLPLGVNMTMES